MTGPREYWPLPPPVAPPWPTTVVWRWRYELAAAAVAGFLARNTGYLLWAVPVLVAVGVALAVPPARSVLGRRMWCVMTQHRLRTGLARGWVHDRRGRLPALIWTSATPDGERVLLWCPAGVTAHHVEGAAEVLRGACWATGIRIRAVRGYRHLVTVQLIRTAPAEALDDAR